MRRAQEEGTASAVVTDVIGSHLTAIAEEMGVALIRSSYSTNIKERRDCSAALIDPDANTIAQAEHVPLHLGSMLGLVPALRDVFGDDIHEGDVFLSNDPYVGGSSHLPDIAVAAPLFQDGHLHGWAVTVAHHAEMGGTRGAQTDVFDEGLRIPPTRLFERGSLRNDVLGLVLANCRVPDERRGDLRAQVAAAMLAVRRYGELCGKYGAPVVLDAIAQWTDKAERQARAAIDGMPTGRFEFVDWMDDDGTGATDIEIRAAIEIGDSRIAIDFAGSDPQVAGPINVVWSALLATVYYTVKAVLDPTLPANAGYYRAIEVSAPENSIVNAGPPVPVVSRSDTCQRIVDVLLGAFAQAVPDRVVAACNGAVTGIEFSGRSESLGPFSYMETIGGGFGARPTSDGPDAVQAHVTNTSNLPIEALELEYPLRVRTYGLREGSGGTGRYRGGLGIVREIEVVEGPVYYRSKGDRSVRGPWGLDGGGEGAKSEFTLCPGTPRERRLGSKESGLLLQAGDVVRVATPGGGGHGSESRREPAAVEADRREEKTAPTPEGRA